MSEHEKMPEPVEMWLAKDDSAEEWQFCDNVDDAECYAQRNGPHKIVPGMMSLDELAEHGVKVICRDANLIWEAESWDGTYAVTEGPYSTALEAQWAATYLARTKQESKP